MPLRRKILLIVFLCGWGCLLYGNTFEASFQLDDYGFIVRNATIKDINNVKAIWSSVLSKPSRFVTFYSFALNYHFHQLDVRSYHITNVVIHLLNTFLVWWLTTMILRIIPREKDDRRAFSPEILGFMIGLLFLSHPVQTQAVTYISQRFASLATFFYLFSLCCYLKGRVLCRFTPENNLLVSLRTSGIFFFFSFLSGLLGMFTKEIVITLPTMICLVEGLFFRPLSPRKKNKAAMAILALCLLVGAVIIPAIFFSKVKGLFFSPRISLSHEGDLFTLRTYVLTQFRVWIHFIRLLFWPLGQNLDYDFSMSTSLLDPATLFSFVAFCGILFFSVKTRKRNIFLSLGIWWFFLTLAPNFVPRPYALFEHKLYLPSIGFFIFLLGVFLSLLSRDRRGPFIFIPVVLFYSFLTVQRNKVWQTPVTLWEDVVRKSPDKSRPHCDLGLAYLQVGRYAESLRHLNKALALNPNYAEAYNNRGSLHRAKNRLDLALKDYDRAIEISPEYATAYNNRGVIYQLKKKEALALENYQKAIQFNPHYDSPYFNQGMLYKYRGEFDKALTAFQAGVKVNPLNVKMLYNRAEIYRIKGQPGRAIADFIRVTQLNPHKPDAFIQLGVAFGQRGEYDKAISFLTQAIQVAPEAGIPYWNRALAYEAKGQYREALKDAMAARDRGQKVEENYIQKLQSLIE